MKIVFDTNVLLSALITQGLSSRVLSICIDQHNIYTSEWIINEVLDKLNNKFNAKNTEVKRVKEFLLNISQFVNPEGEKPHICRDIDDNNILHLAEYIKADLIITGDKDLLVLKQFSNTKIINPRNFIEKFHNVH